MLFHTPIFVGFFTVYLTLHLLVPSSWRVFLIVFGSTIFYGYWNPGYVWVPFVLMTIAYLGGITLAKEHSERSRRLYVGLVLAGLLSPLIFFKYTNFLAVSLTDALGLESGPLIVLNLPLGISFVTFTSIAYVIDVYRRDFDAIREPGRLAAYTLFFPHLIAGPILRPKELIPQIDRLGDVLDAKFRLGAMIVVLGLVKKLFFADSIAPYVDEVYSGVGMFSAVDYAVAIYGFSVQIYCDFSGYTDMAIGLALMLKVRLPTNFSRPYCATSIVDFWRRWHITLSSWLRDYLYIPLGGNRCSRRRQLINVLITMALGGLWHGASWTFVFWGVVHGVGISVAQSFRGLPIPFPRWVAIILTFHFVSFAWILFRAPDLSTAWRIAGGLFSVPVAGLIDGFIANLIPILLILLFFFTHRLDNHARLALLVRKVPSSVLWPPFAAIVVYLLIERGGADQFIYFEF